MGKTSTYIKGNRKPLLVMLITGILLVTYILWWNSKYYYVCATCSTKVVSYGRSGNYCPKCGAIVPVIRVNKETGEHSRSLF